MSGPSTVRIVEVYPALLGTYGDHGNLLVLAHRARRRGLEVETVSVAPGRPLPRQGDVYLIGGAEDAAQVAATAMMRTDGAIADAVDRNAPLLAVCAGMQMLGRQFPGPDGAPVPGLEIFDLVTTPGPWRAIGELVAEPAAELALPVLTGFENHGGRTVLGPSAVPLGRVRVGFGNDDHGTEGVLAGHALGTYLHGPALARNPALADLLLSWVAGPLAPLPDPLVDEWRAERIAAAPESVRVHRRIAAERVSRSRPAAS